MPADPSNRFQSVLSAFMEKFLQEKHACGYAYHEETRILRCLDNFLVQEGLTTYEFPGSIAREVASKESARKCGNPTAKDHCYSALLQIFAAAWLFRVCARFHISCTKLIDFCPKNANRRRASQVLSDSGQA